MAVNGYYSSSPSRAGMRSNPTSPRLPSDPYAAYDPQHAQPSPSYKTSSYEDTSYHPYADQSHQSLSSPYYAAGGGGREYGPNSYSDDVPLRQYPSKGDSSFPMHNTPPDDPTIIDRPLHSPGQERQKLGIFGKKRPWVVYIFTLIQVVVFIVELAKNGKHTGCILV